MPNQQATVLAEPLVLGRRLGVAPLRSLMPNRFSFSCLVIAAVWEKGSAFPPASRIVAMVIPTIRYWLGADIRR